MQVISFAHATKPGAAEMADRTEILLYSAARAQLVRQEIRPRLLAGDLVLSDRYADSTLAYQGYGHGLDLNTLRQITAFQADQSSFYYCTIIVFNF